MGKPISGFAKASNLRSWSDYAKKNSYGHNKAQCREQLAPAGRHDREDDYIPNTGDWQETQRQSEGKGYTFTNDLARKNSFTGDK